MPGDHVVAIDWERIKKRASQHGVRHGGGVAVAPLLEPNLRGKLDHKWACADSAGKFGHRVLGCRLSAHNGAFGPAWDPQVKRHAGLWNENDVPT